MMFNPWCWQRKEWLSAVSKISMFYKCSFHFTCYLLSSMPTILKAMAVIASRCIYFLSTFWCKGAGRHALQINVASSAKQVEIEWQTKQLPLVWNVSFLPAPSIKIMMRGKKWWAERGKKRNRGRHVLSLLRACSQATNFLSVFPYFPECAAPHHLNPLKKLYFRKFDVRNW